MWYAEDVKGYNIITAMGKFNGFNILNFRPLEDSIFKKYDERTEDEKRDLGLFARHHPSGLKESYLPWDQLLIDRDFHFSFEALDEDEQWVIILGFEELMNSEKFIDRDLIEQVFEDNPWVYENWYAQEDFEDNLKTLNHYRWYIEKHGFEQWLKDFYPTVHERFLGQYGLEVWELFQYSGFLGGFDFSYESKGFK